jgi:hypothetical protein
MKLESKRLLGLSMLKIKPKDCSTLIGAIDGLLERSKLNDSSQPLTLCLYISSQNGQQFPTLQRDECQIIEALAVCGCIGPNFDSQIRMTSR